MKPNQSAQKAQLENLMFNLSARIQNWGTDLGKPEDRPELVIVELAGNYPERTHRTFPEMFLKKTDSLEEFEAKLDALGGCSWLKGVIFRVGELDIDWAKAFSIRKAIERLSQNKPTYGLLSALDMKTYFAVSSAQKLIAPESADLNLCGLAINQSFFKDALSRLGIEFEAFTIREYKSALSRFTQNEMTEPQRQQLERILESITETFTQEVGTSRNLNPDAVRSALQKGIVNAQEALDLKLIDRIAYEDEVMGPKHQPLNKSQRSFKTPLREGPGRVAVVSLIGDIIVGKSRRSFLPILGSASQAGSESIVRAFRLAEEDDSTQAIVFYVNSGGGSPLASDLIGQEIKRIGRKKPIVAVMGGAAASGGYYVLTHAHHIVASPMTLTGSIGVVLGKPNLEAFNATYGIHVESLSTSPYADLLSTHRPFTEEETDFLKRQMEDIYDRFITRVSDGRNKSKAEVNEIGRGRVWTGQDAVGIGLVDELGTLSTGIEKAKELAGLPAQAAVWTVETPKHMVMPKSGEGLLEWFYPLIKEQTLLYMPFNFKI